MAMRRSGRTGAFPRGKVESGRGATMWRQGSPPRSMVTLSRVRALQENMTYSSLPRNIIELYFLVSKLTLIEYTDERRAGIFVG
jgi:hypothetical protein